MEAVLLTPFEVVALSLLGAIALYGFIEDRRVTARARRDAFAGLDEFIRNWRDERRAEMGVTPRVAAGEDSADHPERASVSAGGDRRRGDEESFPARRTESRIEMELVGGHSLRISGTYDPDALACLIRGLSV